MKKITLTAIITVLVMLFSFSSFAATFTSDELTIDIPDTLIEDEAFAEEGGYAGSWYNEEEGFYLDIFIDTNDSEYTYVDFSENDLQDTYDDYIKNYETGIEVEKIFCENVKCNGFKGIRMYMKVDYFGYEIRHLVYGFSTNKNIYYLYFDFEDESNLSLAEEITESLVIQGIENDPEKEGMLQYVLYVAAVAVISFIINFIKKRKAKKQGISLDYQPVLDENGNPVVAYPEGYTGERIPTNDTPLSEEEKLPTMTNNIEE